MALNERVVTPNTILMDKLIDEAMVRSDRQDAEIKRQLEAIQQKKDFGW
jgi:hypothetical protein